MQNASFHVLSCLALTKALFAEELYDFRRVDSANDGAKEISPSDDDKIKERSPDNDEKVKERSPGDGKVKERLSSKQDQEIEKELKLFKNVVIPVVLIATVTFAAGFTLPGGIIADDHPGHGTAVLAKKYAFRVFVISDAFALFCSMLATYWLISTGTAVADHRTRRRIRSAAWICLKLAFSGIFAAFTTGIYVVLAPSCKFVSILLCFFALGSYLLADTVVFYESYILLGTIRARLGYKSCIYPAVHPHVERRLRRALGHYRLPPYWYIIWDMVWIFSIYALFFLIGMIKK